MVTYTIEFPSAKTLDIAKARNLVDDGTEAHFFDICDAAYDLANRRGVSVDDCKIFANSRDVTQSVIKEIED